MLSKKSPAKKIALTPADHKHVQRIAAKMKMSEQEVVEKALDAAQPLLKLITQAVRDRN